MADASSITVRVGFRPALTFWDAILLRIAGREVRDAYVRVLEAAAARMMGTAPRAASSEQTE